MTDTVPPDYPDDMGYEYECEVCGEPSHTPLCSKCNDYTAPPEEFLEEWEQYQGEYE